MDVASLVRQPPGGLFLRYVTHMCVYEQSVLLHHNLSNEEKFRLLDF